MASPEERLMQWLRDAHAMEQQAEQMLSTTASRLQRYPELRAKLEEHLRETRRQAERVRGCIARRGGETSSLKDTVGRITAVAQGLSGLFVGDEAVKAAMASYTFEHMEIASYRVLAATAEVVGDDETYAVCEEILREEEAMADWLADHLAAVTGRHLGLGEAVGPAGKH